MAARHAARAFCAATLLFAPSFRALAGAAPSPSASPPPEIVHVVTSDRTDETLHNATRTTYVVGRDEIARHGYRTIGDALAGLPGVEITRYGPIGQNVSYGIRGSSSAQVLVLINGLPAAGAFANTVALGTASTAGVRRIEVVEGGGSTLYGTGAIGGIINVITDAQYTPPGAIVRYGSLGDRELQLQTNGISFERIVAGNTVGLPPAAGSPSERGNSDDETTTLRYGVDRRIGAFDAALRAGIENDRLGAAGGYPYLSSSSRESDVNGDSSLALSLTRAHSTATIQLGGSRQQILFACDAVSDPNCFSAVPSLATESRLNASIRDAIRSATGSVLYGADFSRGDVRGDDGSGKPGSVGTAALAQSAAYVQLTRALRRGEFYAGVRGERDGALGGEFSPSAGIRAEIARGLEIKLNAATAFRAPNASELYFPGYGNSSLRPERAQVADVTLDDARAAGGISAAWFMNRTNDLIVVALTGYDANKNPIFHPENVDHAAIEGLTLRAATPPLHGVSTSLALTDLYRALDVDTGTRLANDPVFAIALTLDLAGSARARFHDGGIVVRATGARSAVDHTQPLFAQAAAYNTVDAFARFRVVRGALLAIRGYNLGNERYAEVSGYPMPGRGIALELSTQPK